MSGRYDRCEELLHTAPGGGAVRYLAPRIIPFGYGTRAATTAVRPGEIDRLDLIAHRALDNAQLGWRIADANGALDPFDLCKRAGTGLDLPASDL